MKRLCMIYLFLFGCLSLQSCENKLYLESLLVKTIEFQQRQKTILGDLPVYNKDGLILQQDKNNFSILQSNDKGEAAIHFCKDKNIDFSLSVSKCLDHFFVGTDLQKFLININNLFDKQDNKSLVVLHLSNCNWVFERTQGKDFRGEKNEIVLVQTSEDESDPFDEEPVYSSANFSRSTFGRGSGLSGSSLSKSDFLP